ncbi:hypothetical protein QQZ08_007311 [Neonectria magnoliae]|uniref:Uncharacterized protein n=1 Tax=Neonectria magnoliae TaxID=2732573 RepID=A0ABR1HXZ0_9HYPO
MGEYVEFYVTCNPPLLPSGVSSVIAQIREQLPSKVLEVLYEPGIPWFKFITDSGHQAEVTALAQSILENLLEAETDVIYEDQDGNETSVENVEPRVDIDLIADEPQVVPWSLYHCRNYAGACKYKDQFPAQIKELPYRAVWRGLESIDKLTLTDLLAAYGFLWSYPGQESGLQLLEGEVNCQITHNLAGNLVYIGSDMNPECIAIAILKLENLLTFHNSWVRNSAHLVFTESEDTQKLSFRWLSHVGLDKLTYVNDTFSGVQREGNLLHRACVRVNDANARGGPEPDKTVYPITSQLGGPFRPILNAFADFEYRPKQAGSGPIGEVKDSFPMFYPQQQHYGTSSKGLARNDVLFATSQLSRPPANMMQQGASASSCVSMTTTDAVASWMAGVEAAGLQPSPACLLELQPPASTDSTTSLRDGYLIDLGHETGSSARLSNGEDSTSQTRQLRDSDDLINLGRITQSPIARAQPRTLEAVSLLDSRVPPALSYGMFAPMNLLPPDKNQTHSSSILSEVSPRAEIHGQDLMDYVGPPIYTPSLMDFPPPSESGNDNNLDAQDDTVPIFGKIESNAKRLHHTMIQKAAPSQTWASIASQPKRQTNEDKPYFGANVVTTLIPDSTTGRDNRGGQAGTGPSSDKKQKISTVEKTPHTPQSFGVSALQPKSRSNKLPSRDAKTVPVMEAEPKEDFSAAVNEALENAEKKSMDILKTLQVTPGHIQLEARFGRICVDVEQSLVNLGEGPSWWIDQVIERLNHTNHDTSADKHVSFYPILTTNGAEADLVPGMCLAQGLPWTLFEKQVCYVISCKSKEDHSQMIKNGGQIVITAKPDELSRWYIEGMNIRHIAKYHNSPKSRTYLTMTMTQVVRKVGHSNYQGTTRPVSGPGKGTLDRWFEASIGSSRANELLRENIRLEFGNRTTWTTDQFKKENIIKALCKPALEMVNQMDEIGQTNQNNEGPKVSRRGLKTLPNSNKNYMFW